MRPLRGRPCAPGVAGPRLRRAFVAQAAAMPPPAPALLLAAIEEQGDQHAVHRATADTAEATVQVGRLDVVESQIVMTDSWVRRTGATSGVREGV